MSDSEYVDGVASIRSEMQLEVACTIEAIEDLRGHLEQLERLLQGSQYEESSAIGYNDISAGYVYLQRCLGGIEELHFREQGFVQQLARNRGCTESEAKHFIDTEIGVSTPQS